MQRALTLITCGILITTPLLSGCKQKEGDRCQVDSDCEEGFICCVTAEKVAVGGTCLTVDKCGQTPMDSGPTDAQSDLDYFPDAGPKDGPLPEAAQPDLKPDTQSTPDTKPTPDTQPTPDTRPPDTGSPQDQMVDGTQG